MPFEHKQSSGKSNNNLYSISDAALLIGKESRIVACNLYQKARNDNSLPLNIDPGVFSASISRVAETKLSLAVDDDEISNLAIEYHELIELVRHSALEIIIGQIHLLACGAIWGEEAPIEVLQKAGTASFEPINQEQLEEILKEIR